MLILTRRISESIMIGDDIKITVLSAHGGMVRFGVEAPAFVNIYREEIYKRMQEETRIESEKGIKEDEGKE